jgi:hypothetical protein
VTGELILLGLRFSILLAFMFMPLTASNHRGITVFAADEFARPFQIGEILNIDQYTAIALIAVVAVFAALSGYYLVTRRHKARQQTPVLSQEPGRVTKLHVAKPVLAYDEEQPEMMSAPEPTQRTRGEYKGFFEFRDDSSGARARAAEEKVESPPIMPRKYCSNCGEAISAQAKFCDKCGAPQ